MSDDGHRMHTWASDLWPYPRSLTGYGVRQTLEYLAQILTGLEIHEVPTGSPAQDWEVPNEWTVREAYFVDPNGRRHAEWKTNNLHLLGYSSPINDTMSLEELDRHLYTSPAARDAVPYVTSYYTERWGFCISKEERDLLPQGDYKVVIDTDLSPGSLTYADLVLPGRSKSEVMLSTYVCHPSMANNELSGIVVQAALASWIAKQDNLWYSYRFVFAPETIGALVYLEKHLDHLRESVKAGWVISCVGDPGPYSIIPSRREGTLSERVLRRALRQLEHDVVNYNWADRGSDERQWCAPLVDLPMCGFSRSKYGTYPEYHTSLDDLSLVTPQELEASLRVLQRCVCILEEHPRFQVATTGEPQMGRRGLYPTLSNQSGGAARRDMTSLSTRRLMDILSYCDGTLDAIELAALVDQSLDDVLTALNTLEEASLVRRV